MAGQTLQIRRGGQVVGISVTVKVKLDVSSLHTPMFGFTFALNGGHSLRHMLYGLVEAPKLANNMLCTKTQDVQRVS